MIAETLEQVLQAYISGLMPFTVLRNWIVYASNLHAELIGLHALITCHRSNFTCYVNVIASNYFVHFGHVILDLSKVSVKRRFALFRALSGAEHQ
jgi:hypothetical protein